MARQREPAGFDFLGNQTPELCGCRLLAGSAHIHVDFHAYRHFEDFWCFPSHLPSLFNRMNVARRGNLVRIEKFAS
jgi:hypothetical protein